MHKSVLLHESLEPLLRHPGTLFVDCTLGGGGHTGELLKARPDARVIALDRDPDMIARARTRFQAEIAAGRLILVHANFSELAAAVKPYTEDGVDGILADFGVSSFQLDIPERGFSFQRSGPLDMRMDTTASVTAYDLVNTASPEELARIFQDYGEERFAWRVAQRIAARRAENPIADTADLAEVVRAAIPNARAQKIHPATRVFQALRMAVNGELDEVESLLALLPGILRPGGVFCAISFHSLEDRLVKERLKLLSDACICPPEIITCERCNRPPGRLGARKPIVPGEAELAENPRSRSAKLRVFYRNEGK